MPYVTNFTPEQETNNKIIAQSLQIEQGNKMSFKEADSEKADPKYNWLQYFF